MFKMATTCVAGASSTFWIKKTSEVILEIEPQNLKTGRDLRRLLAQPPHFASEETEAQGSQDWLIKTGNTVLMLFPITARRQPRLHTVTIVCPRVVFQRTMRLLLCLVSCYLMKLCSSMTLNTLMTVAILSLCVWCVYLVSRCFPNAVLFM